MHFRLACASFLLLDFGKTIQREICEKTPSLLVQRGIKFGRLFYFTHTQLFDVAYREETLMNVIRSVTRNGRSIILTAILGIILVYLFSIVGYLFFQHDFIVDVDPLNRTGKLIISIVRV